METEKFKFTIAEDDVEWLMKYSDGREKMIFEKEKALALLLLNDVVFLNSNWWEDKWPDDAKKLFSINVNCNDVFAWGCADADSLMYYDLEDLYKMWRKDPEWGPAVWCIKKRNLMPQKPVEDLIRKAGIWDLDSMGLSANTYEEHLAALKDKE